MIKPTTKIEGLDKLEKEAEKQLQEQLRKRKSKSEGINQSSSGIGQIDPAIGMDITPGVSSRGVLRKKR
jgi:hypothetical protein